MSTKVAKLFSLETHGAFIGYLGPNQDEPMEEGTSITPWEIAPPSLPSRVWGKLTRKSVQKKNRTVKMRIAAARAQQEVIATHVRCCLDFVALFQDKHLDEHIEEYLFSVDLEGELASVVYSKVLAEFDATTYTRGE